MFRNRRREARKVVKLARAFAALDAARTPSPAPERLRVHHLTAR
jgi:hypothetical protein